MAFLQFFSLTYQSLYSAACRKITLGTLTLVWELGSISLSTYLPTGQLLILMIYVVKCDFTLMMSCVSGCAISRFEKYIANKSVNLIGRNAMVKANQAQVTQDSKIAFQNFLIQKQNNNKKRELSRSDLSKLTILH